MYSDYYIQPFPNRHLHLIHEHNFMDENDEDWEMYTWLPKIVPEILLRSLLEV